MRYQNIIAKIEREWDSKRLKVISYIPSSEIFILSDIDATFDKIESHLTTIKNVHQSKNATHVKERIEEWMKNLIIMCENLQKCTETQSN